MPRNSAGTFSLVAGNPVVDDTVIEATWANDTLNDLAAEITDSLSRSGKGGMLVPMEFADGTVGDPAITFSAAPTTGLYRAGTNDVRFSLAGVDLIQLAATIIKFIARVTDGASAVGFEIDTTNALANAGAKLLRVLNATVEKLYVDKDGGVHSDLLQALAAVGATLKGNVADGATAVGVILDNVNALANAAAKALSVRVAGVEKFAIGKSGEIIAIANGNNVAISAPAALAAGYALTLPPWLPVNDSVVLISTTGELTTGSRRNTATAISPYTWTAANDAGYWLDLFDTVHLRGRLNWITGASGIVFEMANPVYHPGTYPKTFTIPRWDASASAWSQATLVIAANGDVTCEPAPGPAFATGDYIMLEGVHFRTDD